MLLQDNDCNIMCQTIEFNFFSGSWGFFLLFTKLNTACCQLETPARNSCWTCYIYIIEVQLNYTLRTSPLILKKQCLFILKLHYSNPVKADSFHLIMNLITGCELHTQNIRLNGSMCKMMKDEQYTLNTWYPFTCFLCTSR